MSPATYRPLSAWFCGTDLPLATACAASADRPLRFKTSARTNQPSWLSDKISSPARVTSSARSSSPTSINDLPRKKWPTAKSGFDADRLLEELALPFGVPEPAHQPGQIELGLVVLRGSVDRFLVARPGTLRIAGLLEHDRQVEVRLGQPGVTFNRLFEAL